MRQFFEEWAPYLNRQPSAGDLEWKEFLSIGFSHHTEIIAKVKDVDARIFYIHECATPAWDKYTLRDYIKSGLYQGTAYVFFRSPPVVIGGLDLQLKKLSRELNPDDIIILSEGMIP